MPVFIINMQINTNYNHTTFTSRAQIIKEADKICRNVNKTFPHFSPSYSWINFNMPEKYDPNFSKIEQKLKNIRNQTDKAPTPFKYYNTLMKLVKKYKCANCGELADITYISCKNKNLKDVNIVGIYGYNPKKKKYVEYDHIAVSFKSGKKQIVIDPWFGIADFANNCLVEYKQKYHKFFKNFNPNLKMILKKEDRYNIDPYDIKKIMNKYPEL